MERIVRDSFGREVLINRRGGFVEARYRNHKRVRVFDRTVTRAINALNFFAPMRGDYKGNHDTASYAKGCHNKDAEAA